MKYVVTFAFILLAVPAMFGQGAFTNDYGMHYVNDNNPDVRFDWTNHRMAVPGQGGAHANENAAVMEWGAGTLVSPNSN